MSSNNFPTPLQSHLPGLQESLHNLEVFEQELYHLLKEHPCELLLHVSLALTVVAIDLISNLIALLQSKLNSKSYE
jgi:hypothetical protein